RRKPLLGELEADARPGRRLEEQIDDRLAAEHRDLLDAPLRDLLEGLGGIENAGDLLPSEKLETDQVLAEGQRRVAHRPPARGSTSSTPSCPSSSGTSTSTRWCGSAWTVRPTMSGWIGSSRPPRSTSTQSRMRSGRPQSVSSLSAARTVRPV